MIIPEPRFYLKDKKSKQRTLIVMQVKYNGHRVYLSAVEKINPIDWDIKKQRAIVTRRNLNDAGINIWLDKMSIEFKNIFRSLLLDNIDPTGEIVTKQLQENLKLSNIIKPEVSVIKTSLFSFAEVYIKECSTSKSINTVKSYNSTLTHLKTYSSILQKELDFDDITHEFRSSFIKYLQKLNLGKNTLGKHIKIIKSLMLESSDAK